MGDIKMQLYKHQQDALAATADLNRVAYYHDMGLGKTYTGAEKMHQLGGRVNLVICQKSKIDDWAQHFLTHYGQYFVYDLTDKRELDKFANYDFSAFNKHIIGVINYELIFRRTELFKMSFDTILLDESSMIQNDSAKRTKAIIKLKTENVILLSGTPTGGRYEKLYSQLRLLGWKITKRQYWSEFVTTRQIDMGGFKIQVVTGYKNVDRLKRKMREYGCNFLKTDEVFDLPEQTFTDVYVPTSSEYRRFCKTKVTKVNGVELVGDTALTEMLYQRQLCGAYNGDKLDAVADILDSTTDRIIIFYNFNHELDLLKMICLSMGRPVAEVNGSTKDLAAYNDHKDSVTLIQYQAGAMGLNLQKANKIVYFTPPLSSELYEQSKKRTHRIGQERPCFYYRLTCRNSIEERIYETLEMRQDFTEKLFLKG